MPLGNLPFLVCQDHNCFCRSRMVVHYLNRSTLGGPFRLRYGGNVKTTIPGMPGTHFGFPGIPGMSFLNSLLRIAEICAFPSMD